MPLRARFGQDLLQLYPCGMVKSNKKAHGGRSALQCASRRTQTITRPSGSLHAVVVSCHSKQERVSVETMRASRSEYGTRKTFHKTQRLHRLAGLLLRSPMAELQRYLSSESSGA
jgi:hypothetical protein